MSGRSKASTKHPKKLSHLVVRAAPRDGRRAIVQAGSLRFPAALGAVGERAASGKGTAQPRSQRCPCASPIFGGDRMRFAATGLPLVRVKETMLWCDAPSDPNYNRAVKFPFRASHEKLMRTDRLYDLCIVIGLEHPDAKARLRLGDLLSYRASGLRADRRVCRDQSARHAAPFAASELKDPTQGSLIDRPKIRRCGLSMWIIMPTLTAGICHFASRRDQGSKPAGDPFSCFGDSHDRPIFHHPQ